MRNLNNFYQNYTIYLVEDDENLRRLIDIRLNKHQLKSVDFACGADLLNYLDKIAKDHLIILDFNLPDIKGKELIEKLLQLDPNYQFIVMTGYGDEKIAVEVMKLGAKDYLVKDTNFLELLPSTVKQVINQIETEKALVEAQKALKDNEEKYRLITENSNALISEMNHNGDILYVNTKFITDLGYTLNELNDKNIFRDKIILKDDNVINLYKNLYIDLIPFRYELQIKNVDGVYNWYLCNASAFKTESGKLKIVNILHNITETKQNEEELKKAKEEAIKANETKTQFLANMSHEIRTPLNGILGIASLLAKTELNEKQKNYVDMIKTSGSILLNLINDILDISKIEAGKYVVKNEVFSLKELIELLNIEMSTLADSKNLKLLYDVDKEIPDLLIGDYLAINQILVNLVGNSIKFTERGDISIVVKKSNINEDDITLRFVIKDQGIGISEENTTKVFDRFKQVDDGLTKKNIGTGLGLSIVKQLVDVLDGTIWLESEIERGSTFTVELPFKIAKDKLKDDSSFKLIINSNVEKINKTILIVEDNVINTLFLKDLLEGEGYRIDIANNGVKGVEKASKTTYDLIFMDIQMPEMDGLTATKILRENGIKTPIIALTAYSMKEDRERCISSGANDYISKPISESEVFEKLDKYLKDDSKSL